MRASWSLSRRREDLLRHLHGVHRKGIRSELIETRDFVTFRMSPLSGTAARNKGMALFPRKINGKYAMIARQDNENLYLIYSDDLYTWNGGAGHPEAAVSLGVRADRQLRLADRAR